MEKKETKGKKEKKGKKGKKGKKEKKEKWESRSERRLGDGDRVLFTRLDPDSYRVAFKLGSKHFISDQEVSLDEGSAVVVIATVNELAAGDKREPGALPIDVVEMLPDLSLGGPGFHWK